MRKNLAVALTALVALTAPTGCAAAGGQPGASPGSTASTTTPAGEAASAPARIGLSYIPNVQFAPFYLAEADGLFAAGTGTPATLRHHGAQEGLFTAIAAGQEDFVLAGGDELLQARESGADLVAVATYYRQYPIQILVPTDGGITSLADLKGKRIGVPGRFGSSWFGLLVALRTAGLAEADVDVVEIGYTQQAALTSHKVDAVVGFTNNDLVQFELAGLAVQGLPIADGAPPLVGASLVTTRAYLEANPEVVKGVAEAMVAGINAVAADPDRALAETEKQVPGLTGEALDAARATLTATIAIMTDESGHADGRLDTGAWSAMARFMLDAGLLATPADVAAATAADVLG